MYQVNATRHSYKVNSIGMWDPIGVPDTVKSSLHVYHIQDVCVTFGINSTIVFNEFLLKWSHGILCTSLILCVLNTVLVSVSVCPSEYNILVPVYFNVPFRNYR